MSQWSSLLSDKSYNEEDFEDILSFSVGKNAVFTAVSETFLDVDLMLLDIVWINYYMMWECNQIVYLTLEPYISWDVSL